MLEIIPMPSYFTMSVEPNVAASSEHRKGTLRGALLRIRNRLRSRYPRHHFGAVSLGWKGPHRGVGWILVVCAVTKTVTRAIPA